MAVSFNQIPQNLRVPFAFFELNPSAATYQSNSRLLLIGQMTAAGSAVANEPILVTTGEDGLFGYGSAAARMYKVAVANAPFQEIWVAPLADAAGSAAAVATITVSGTMPVTTAGTIQLYIGGINVPVGVTTIDTQATVAANIAAAINASYVALEATATVAGNVVTLTARNKGTVSNDLHVETKLKVTDGPLADSLLTIVDFAGGATDPSIAAVLTNLGSEEFDFIAMPYSDANNISLLTTFLDARWNPSEMLYGAGIVYMAGTAAALQAFGTTLNDPNLSVYGGYMFSSSKTTIVAAIGANHAAHLQAPPELSRPLQSLPLLGVLGPKLVSNQFTTSARNTLLYSGISTLKSLYDGTVVIDRAITTYQTNAYGAVDTSFLSVNTRAQLVYGVRFMQSYLTSTFPRCGLVDSNPSGIQNIVTVDDVSAAIIHAYSQLVTLGVFQDLATFQSLLVVERDPSDPTRVNAAIKVEGVSQLIILAGNVTSYTSYANALT